MKNSIILTMVKRKVKYTVGFVLLLLLPMYSYAEEAKTMPEVLTLEDSINIALKNNYDILFRKEEIKEAQARLQHAWSQVFPYISANANYTRYEDHPYITFEDNRGYSFSASQLLFSGGRVVNTINSAHKCLKATEIGEKELENKIIYNTKQAFYNIILAKEFVRIRKETLELAEENLSIAKERYKKGEASHYDLLRSEVEAANIKPQLIKAENFLKGSYNFLKVLLANNPAKEIEVKGSFNYAPEEVNLNKEVNFALKRRPALKEIALQVKAAKAQVRVASAGYLPQVNLNFTDYSNQKESFSVGREKYDDYWIAGITVNMPLFDGFLTHSKVKEAKAKERKIRILKDKLIDNVRIEVENTVLNLKAAKSTIESQEENVTRAKEAHQIIRQKYALGQASQIDLLDAQVALSTAKVNYAQSLYDFIIAKAELSYVVGKGEN